MHHVFLDVKRLRGPGIEPGSTAWKATMLTITPATPTISVQARGCPPFQTHPWSVTTPPVVVEGKNGVSHCILRGSNPRGLCPLGLKSSALTTRPRMRVRNTCCRRDGTQKGWCSQSETRTHNLPVNSRARCRLRHPGTRMMKQDSGNPQKGVYRLRGSNPRPID